MDPIFIYIFLGIGGLMAGSFAGATMWRLRARQLAEDEAACEVVDKQEYKKLVLLTKASFASDRSHCLHCGHILAWYDLIPLISWLSTAGKCRYCHQFIGWFEPIVELATALIFVVSYLFWPAVFDSSSEVIRFLLWLIAVVMLIILFCYDLRWYLLPNKVMFPLIGVATVFAILSLAKQHDLPWGLLNTLLAVAILSGLYFLFWVLSKGSWIGFGDVKLGLALALLLGQWQLAFLALFAANMIGCLVVLPGLLAGKISRQTRVSFGPLLIIGAFIAMFWGVAIIDWYFMTFA